MYTELAKILLKQPVIYVARDLERALGILPDTPGYYIISNYTPFANSKVGKSKNVLLIRGQNLLDTQELLQTPESLNFISNISPKPLILVFKSSRQVEKICIANNWLLLNPKSEITTPIEEKITQLKQLPDILDLFPKYIITKCQDIKFTGTKIVLQYNHSHTGNGTILINDAETLTSLQTKFPEREVRVTEFIAGPLFTNNNIIWNEGVLIGNISYQITGMPAFTDNPFATIGNDWALAKKILSKEALQAYQEIVQKIAATLRAKKMLGLFGIDMIYDFVKKRWWLIEINARQPASTTYESMLQSLAKADKNDITTFEAHLAALLNLSLAKSKLIEINEGAQIILRNKKVTQEIIAINHIQKELENAGLQCLNYGLDSVGSDLLRIQSQEGMLEKNEILNELGKKIEKIILC